MGINQRIESLIRLGQVIKEAVSKDHPILDQARQHNPWFTNESTKNSLRAIVDTFLEKSILEYFVSNYQIHANTKNVGVICAGNIPAVGFHDIMCIYLAGHHAMVKLSDKDTPLMTWLINELNELANLDTPKIAIVDRLANHDAVIATGSNNTSLYFKKYFGHLPHIIRQNRNAVAVLNGEENQDQLFQLGHDIFTYFGLGCRNVSKVYLPKGYDLPILLESLHQHNEIILHHKYKNNFDYNMALFLLNKSIFFNNGCILLKEDQPIPSRIASCHYSYYEDNRLLADELNNHRGQIQCVVSSHPIEGFKHFDFGQAQRPAIDDYADGVDTMLFLTKEI